MFNGKTPAQSEQRSTGHPVLKIKDVSALGEFRGRFESFVDASLATALAEKQIRDGDILILNAAHNADYVASKTFLAQPLTIGALATGEWLIIRPQQDALTSGFLHHWVNSSLTRRRLREMVKGIHLYPKDVARLHVPLPPLLDQRRITAILDKADELRANRRAALKQLNGFTQAMFFEMFGDPVRNQREWSSLKIAAFCKIVRGSSPRPQGDPRYFGGPVPRLMVADVTRDGWLVTPRIDSLTTEGAKRSRPVQAGTVVMAVSGDVGVVSRLAIDACVHDGFIAFTELDESCVDPTYFLALLHYSKSTHDKRKAGAIFTNLTTTDIKNMSVPVPPLSLQHSFSRRYGAVQQSRKLQVSSLTAMDALFSSLQRGAFGGEL